MADTVRRRGWRYIELITQPADLREWLDHERGRLVIPAEVDPAMVSRFLLVRDQVLRVLRATVAGTALPALGAPVLEDVRTYPAKVMDGTVYIEVD